MLVGCTLTVKEGISQGLERRQRRRQTDEVEGVLRHERHGVGKRSKVFEVEVEPTSQGTPIRLMHAARSKKPEPVLVM
jgi:hypothetical protein